MLSAIAARRAAQTLRADTSTIQVAEEESEDTNIEEEDVVVHVKKRVKRKPLANRSLSGGTTKKKPRYFAEKQGEPIPGSASSSDAEIDQHIGRAWSPSVPLQDASDEEQNRVKSPATLQRLTTFTPTLNQNIFHLSQDKLSVLGLKSAQGTLIAISAEETLCIGGTYLLTILRGTISLLGASIGASTRCHRVYAPKSSPLPVLEAVSSEPSILSDEVSSRLGFDGLCGAIVLIQELRTGIQGLGNLCKVFSGVFDYDSPSEDTKMLNVPGAYMLRNQEKDFEPYVLPKSWATAFDNMSPPASGGVYFIKGPKKTGKSTFARTLLNRLLAQFERVAYLECDPGQSEFTPGGMVALNVIEDYCFGPPFSHPTLPNRAHYIGATTPRSSPAHYLASVQALFQVYELDVRTPILSYDDRMDVHVESELVLLNRKSDVIPLVVNTMGWNKGIGADLTQRIQDIVQPTHVFEITALNSLDDFNYETNPPDFGFESKSQFYAQIDPIVPSSVAPLHTLYTPADHRVINLLSHLHAVFPTPSREIADLSSTTSLEQITATSWRTALPLCSQVPYAVDWRVALDRVVLVGSSAEDVIPAEVGRVLNGALVGLVSSWEDGVNSNGDVLITDSGNQYSQELSSTHHMLPYVQGAQPPAPTSSTCLGIALIRSMSHSSPTTRPGVPETESSEVEMHVLTPVPPTFLKHSRVFVKGEMELPVWGMLDYNAGGDDDEWKNGVAGVEWGRVPYLQWGKGEGAGSQRRRVRRNLMRKAQM